MEPPRKMGVKRLRSPTLVGVAPPSAVNKGKQAPAVDEIPKITVDGAPEDEATTLVGKMLAESAAQARRNLEAKDAESDTYQDETATSVGDAERLIATANAAAADAGSDDLEEPTGRMARAQPAVEDTTARRDAIDVQGAMHRAAELEEQLEAEAAKKKKAEKKRTMVGLGEGPLMLPAVPPQDETAALTGGPPVKRSELAEPPTAPVPMTPRDRAMTAPISGAHPSAMGMPVGPPSPYAQPAATPASGVAALPPYPGPRPADALAFAQTQQAMPPQPFPAPAEKPKKKSRAGVVVFLVVLLGAAGGAAYWKRVPLRARWDRFRHPPVAQPAASVEPAPPPSATASVSIAPSASASASASASSSASAKPAAKKPPPAKPKPPKAKAPVPKPASEHGF